MHHNLWVINALIITIALNFGGLQRAVAQTSGEESQTERTSAPAVPSPIPESDQPAESDAEAIVLFYMAVGAWIAILTAATLAVVIMAHRIAVAQRIRPLSGSRLHTRNSL